MECGGPRVSSQQSAALRHKCWHVWMKRKLIIEHFPKINENSYFLGFRPFPGGYKENSTCWIDFCNQIWAKITICRPNSDPKYRFISIPAGKPEKQKGESASQKGFFGSFVTASPQNLQKHMKKNRLSWTLEVENNISLVARPTWWLGHDQDLSEKLVLLLPFCFLFASFCFFCFFYRFCDKSVTNIYKLIYKYIILY